MTSGIPLLAHTSISDHFINAVTTVLKLTHIQPCYYMLAVFERSSEELNLCQALL